MDTVCKTCGERYRLGAEHECQPKRAATKSTAARKDVLGARLPGVSASKAGTAGTQAPPVDTPVPAKVTTRPLNGMEGSSTGKFNKVAYQREYMRKWRAKNA